MVREFVIVRCDAAILNVKSVFVWISPEKLGLFFCLFRQIVLNRRSLEEQRRIHSGFCQDRVLELVNFSI